jgi:ankyrin repeat protein
LKGRYFANLFIHFIPVDHDQVNALDKKLHPSSRVSGHEGHNHDADELVHGDHYSESEENEAVIGTPGQTELHRAAQRGDFHMVESILTSDKKMLHLKDVNGWTPFHEAVHGGHLEVAKLLISHGAAINAKSNNGGTPLWWAKGTFDEGHPMIGLLESMGALDEGDL